jgi:hypothetical protein
MTARNNPFASRCIERLTFQFEPGDDWGALLARLESNRWRGAIVGPHGTGKTTVLEQIAPHLRARGFQPRMVALREGYRFRDIAEIFQRSAAVAPAFILLDSGERLTVLQWLLLRMITGRAAGLLVTQHSRGRLPTVLEMNASPKLLRDLVGELCAVDFHGLDVHELFQRHGGNIRECFRELYEHAATDAIAA